MGGVCEAQPDGPTDRGCRSDADCPQGYRCATSTGQCVPEVASPMVPYSEVDCVSGDTRRCGSKIGACTYGLEQCVDGRWTGRCDGAVGPTAEVCNQLDDDCDGAADDPFDVGTVCAVGLGVCAQMGVRVCDATDTSTTVCGATALSAMGRVEQCGNQLDDDCDGLVNEGFNVGDPCSAGVGACQRTGAMECDATDTSTTVCNATPLSAAGRMEICTNGVDDDCDGDIDEGCTVPVAMCPGPVTTQALVPVTLTGSGFDPDGQIVAWRWTLVSAPPRGSGTFSAPTAATTAFTPNLVGVYTVQLTVTDNSGQSASCQTTVTARGRGLRVEVTWSTNNSDVDTHLLRFAGGTAWFNTPNDCYYANQRPAWDAPGTTDDPRLDIDDTNGLGPENINIDVPVTGSTYRVGVHYYSDHGTGPTTATVRIYCGDVSTTPQTVQTRLLSGSSTSDSNDFWRVADVRWLGNGNCVVTVLSSLTTAASARIIP